MAAEPKDEVWTGAHQEPTLTFRLKEYSDWECHPLGMSDVTWRPAKGARIPNSFQRWMLRVFFATVWTKRKDA